MSSPTWFKTVSGDGRELHCNYTIDELIIEIYKLKEKLDWYENVYFSQGEFSLNTVDDKHYKDVERCVKRLKDFEWILEMMNARN
jgi:hypothetical protein